MFQIRQGLLTRIPNFKYVKFLILLNFINLGSFSIDRPQDLIADMFDKSFYMLTLGLQVQLKYAIGA